MQYLRDGSLRQLVVIVELKSGGGLRFLRSSMTDAESVVDSEVETRTMKMARSVNMEAIAEEARSKSCGFCANNIFEF